MARNHSLGSSSWGAVRSQSLPFSANPCARIFWSECWYSAGPDDAAALHNNPEDDYMSNTCQVPENLQT
jgi:hypothetical protein